jgi:TetR/AcrR family fatty acid metabolism transcriptional regulator
MVEEEGLEEPACGREGNGRNGGPGRRELARREREERILDAAAAVFAQKGYNAATIRNISSLAGLADGTIYNYFENKFDLLIGILSRLTELEQLPDELVHGLQGEPKDFFVAAFEHRLSRLEQGEEMLQAILPQVLVNAELRERFYHQYVQRIATMLEAYVTAQVERGQLRPVDPEMMVRLVQATFVGLLFLRIIGDESLERSWERVPSFLASVLFEGLEPRGRE